MPVFLNPLIFLKINYYSSDVSNSDSTCLIKKLPDFIVHVQANHCANETRGETVQKSTQWCFSQYSEHANFFFIHVLYHWLFTQLFPKDTLHRLSWPSCLLQWHKLFFMGNKKTTYDQKPSSAPSLPGDPTMSTCTCASVWLRHYSCVMLCRVCSFDLSGCYKK